MQLVRRHPSWGGELGEGQARMTIHHIGYDSRLNLTANLRNRLHPWIVTSRGAGPATTARTESLGLGPLRQQKKGNVFAARLA